MKCTFLDFRNELMGFTFHSKITGYQIYMFEMYWSGLTPIQCFSNYDVKKVIRTEF